MPHAPDLSGRALQDRYELHALIGEGTFGRVYAGRDRRLDRPVAVKVIKPWWTEDPEWVATFEREAQLLARVSDPGIVQIFDVGQAPEGLFTVAELVEGESLAERLRRGPLPAWEACGVAAQLCRALGRAHAARIVHRDVKPANILLSAQGRVKVGDFGVARLAEGSTDGGAASVVGTPRYMAPEQGRGLKTTPATDVYSVGVVLYEMLTGRPPFAGETLVELALRHLQEPPPRLSPRLPDSLVQITERALAKEPARRYADGTEMAEALVEARRRSPAGRRARLAPAHSRPRIRAVPHVHRRTVAPAGAPGPERASGAGPERAGTQGPERVSGGGPRHPGTGSGPGAAPAHRTAARGHTPPPRHPDGTRVAPQASPRRNVNPAARRRAAAALAAVTALVGIMAAASLLLRPSPQTTVPRLTGLTPAAARAAARRHHVAAAFTARQATAAAGTVIGQRPAPGARVPDGTRISAVLSLGPPLVPIPSVTGQAVNDAQQSLRSLGLRTSLRYVPAPGTAPGTVTAQPAGRTAARGSMVVLQVAEVPRWRTVGDFRAGDSGPFHIRGRQWRIVYSMDFQGTCTWVFWCSGPTADIRSTGTGAAVTSFGLQAGSGRTRTFATGPGAYDIRVAPGGDDAAWSVQVQDLY